MHPIILKVGAFTIYSYGLMVAVGFIIATILASRRGKSEEFKILPDKIGTLALVILISGILGARILYCLLNIKDFIANPLEIIMVTHGGLVFYGGAVAAFLAGFVYAKRAGLPIKDTLDLLFPYIALGHAFGRIGCFLNGCCYGRPYNGPLAVTFEDGTPRIPTQLLSAGLLFLLFIFLSMLITRRRFKGQVFCSYVLLYSTGRFLMEFLRGDNPPFLFLLTFSQVISIAAFVIGIFLYLRLSSEKDRK